ncbi:BTB/POZ fold [Ceraceosorus bombacis]|uniref:BTB/POZ fold n=1 Tax=Ceraceosorus bombacis TaxID=401625 RepID=A0A0P1BKV1_9BASI|nr:BTB/POZ fold [Ceraceosorus bombacis]
MMGFFGGSSGGDNSRPSSPIPAQRTQGDQVMSRENSQKGSQVVNHRPRNDTFGVGGNGRTAGDDYSTFSGASGGSVFDDDRSMAPSTVATSVSIGGSLGKSPKEGYKTLSHKTSFGASPRPKPSELVTQPPLPSGVAARRHSPSSHSPVSTTHQPSNFDSALQRGNMNNTVSLQQQSPSVQHIQRQDLRAPSPPIPARNLPNESSKPTSGTVASSGATRQPATELQDTREPVQRSPSTSHYNQTSNDIVRDDDNNATSLAPDNGSALDRSAVSNRGAVVSGDWSVDRGAAAGYGNISAWDQTEASAFTGSDPVAQATDFADGDIIFVSSEAGSGATRQPVTRFKIHEVNLNVHSAVLSEMVDGSPEGKVHTLEEDSGTLKVLFSLMYNTNAPKMGMQDWQVVLRLARAAQKYDCARAKDVAASYFAEQEQLGSLSPFMTFAVGSMYHLPALEEAAAERSVRYDIHRLPELVFNLMGFAAYQKLAAFHTRRQQHYQDTLNSITVDPKELESQCYQTGGVCIISPLTKLKQKLAWPRQANRDGSRKPIESRDVMTKLLTEIGQIDCGTCSRALVEAALQIQLAIETMPRYNEDEEESF